MLGFAKSPEVSVGLLFFVEHRTLETRTNCRTNKELGRRTLGNEPGLVITRMPDSWKRTRTWIMARTPDS
ncbi:unnamed protein product [Rhizophagus irregularis]|nr:unnamed protein product [Rhizophagus irregularis]